MSENNMENKKDLQNRPVKDRFSGELDSASESLSEALRISFLILKIIMVVLVILFFVSGMRTVAPDEQAIVLKFGKIRGIGESRILGPGLHWILPYPIHEMIIVPVKKKIDFSVNSLWYYQSKSELLQTDKNRINVPKSLDPEVDGYCLCRSESRVGAAASETDYNIVHSKWKVTYQIDDPERFFKNVTVTDDLMPGQTYADVIEGSFSVLLQSLIENSAVTAMVNYTIDQAIKSQATITDHVQRLLQQKLDDIDSGVRVVFMKLVTIKWPRQVDDAFLESFNASQTKPKMITEAETYATNTLNETAGTVAEDLLSVIEGRKQVTDEELEYLWSQVVGQCRERLGQARAYRTRIVESAKADAIYLNNILPEYKKRPKLFMQKVYLDAIEEVFANVDEKIIIQPASNAKSKEVRVLLNRDPNIKKTKSKSEETK
ncbi:MAG TPA: SPFH domain-containing protein [Sedimentisphaerales bacterium]|nr:SPFH domain-containing protein [Sedimentisphaerales bacterium]